MSITVPTYYAGQTIAVRLAFLSYGVAEVDEVRVAFVHDENPDVVIELTGYPESSTEYWSVTLEYDVTTDDLLGLYHYYTARAIYAGGRVVPFEDHYSVGFHIEEENIQPPRMNSKWIWQGVYNR